MRFEHPSVSRADTGSESLHRFTEPGSGQARLYDRWFHRLAQSDGIKQGASQRLTGLFLEIELSQGFGVPLQEFRVHHEGA